MDVVSISSATAIMESTSQGVQVDFLGGEDVNILMSLPTCLIQCILSDWVEVISVIRLDFALCGTSRFGLQLLDLLKSNEFSVKEVKQTTGNQQSQPLYALAYSKMLNWLLRREAKVGDLEVHDKCSAMVLEKYLQSFGDHVRRLTLYAPAHMSLAAQYCHNLTTFSINSHDKDIVSLLILRSNPRLETLNTGGGYCKMDEPLEPLPTMHHLKQLKWFIVDDGFDDQLSLLAKAAPKLQQLSISCKPRLSTISASGALMMDVAGACPLLRTLRCGRVHIGYNDDLLQPFLSFCSDIIHLDLCLHDELTDTVLIEALSELNSLHSLNLRGCSRLTDHTLQYLTQRFHNTLKMLYLDYSRVYPRYYGEAVEQGGYTTAGIASLRAQCTNLHTFHYSLQVDARVPAPPLDAYKVATIVDISSVEMIPMVLANCRQIRILSVSSNWLECTSRMVWLKVEQLMTIAMRCPQLHTVITEKNKYGSDECEVDYGAVKEAYPSLLFTKDRSTLDFDVLKMS